MEKPGAYLNQRDISFRDVHNKFVESTASNDCCILNAINGTPCAIMRIAFCEILIVNKYTAKFAIDEPTVANFLHSNVGSTYTQNVILRF